MRMRWMWGSTVWVLALIVAPTGSAWAAGGGSSAAGVSHWIGALNSGARGTAMAGALAADAGGLDCLGINPAGIASLGRAQASFTHHLLIMDSSSEHLALGYSPMEKAGFALGLDYLNFGNVDLYGIDANGMPQAQGQAQPSAYNANLNWGQSVGFGLDLGASAKWLDQNLNGQAASTAAGDLGLRWALPGGPSVGLSFLNFGGQLFGAPLPSETRLGLAYARSSFDLALDLSWQPADQNGLVAMAGAEYKPFELLCLRGGYRQGGADSPSGPSLGLGVNFKVGHLDYAYDMAGAFSNTQQFSLTAFLPQALPNAAASSVTPLPTPTVPTPNPAPLSPVASAEDESPNGLARRLVEALKSQDDGQKRMKALMEKIAVQGLPEPGRGASQAVKDESLKPAVFQGDFESAARDAKAMIELDPQNADGYMALGFLNWHLQRFDDCLLNLRKALELDPSRDYLRAVIHRIEPPK